MMTLFMNCSLTILSFFSPALLAMVEEGTGSTAAVNWHAQTLGGAIGYMVLFTAVGILLAILSYKLFDKCTPGDLHKEIVEHKNVAAAIIGGAVILGVCVIIAAAMIG